MKEKRPSALLTVGSLIFLPTFWLRTFSNFSEDVLMELPILSASVCHYLSVLSKEP